MTLDEAIKHCYDVYNRMKSQDLEDCGCAEEHKQLAKWLEELKERRKNDERIRLLLSSLDKVYESNT